MPNISKGKVIIHTINLIAVIVAFTSLFLIINAWGEYSLITILVSVDISIVIGYVVNLIITILYGLVMYMFLKKGVILQQTFDDLFSDPVDEIYSKKR